MEEPQIRYCTTADGVSIAYFDVGRGTPLLALPHIPWSDIRSEFRLYNFAPRLASEHRLIQYDLRGTGLSQRGVVDFSLSALQLDLDAVINRLDVDRVSLYAEINASTVALAYAAAHPERVDGLILWGGLARARDFWELPRLKAVQSLFEPDWELYTETLAQVIFGFAGGEPAQRYAAYMRDCVNQEEAVAHFAADIRADVTHLLPGISTPTLLLQPSDAAMAPMARGRELASSIPGAQLKVLETSVFWSDEIEDWIITSIRDFLAVYQEASTAAPSTAGTGTAIILFTDIVDSTALTERLGDTVFRTASRTLDEGMRAAMREAGGTVVEGKVLGDGVMGVFKAASQAILAARRCIELSEEGELRLHVGLHAGDVSHEAGNVYGGAVNIASRICGLSAPGEILVSATVRELARTSAGVTFADRGKHALKGIDDPVRLYEVRGRNDDA